ncbi:MAG: beta-ketoacyl-[acyl-carrier-protein] synthase family protein [Lachnospiraceae bacterium]|nr:beta-ketoacyl-[acyl-carrier-protein] synthase family protein [Lachnospiraceae bacterium]
MKDRKVVVTGMGVTTALGDSPDIFYENLLKGLDAVKCVEESFGIRLKRKNAVQMSHDFSVPVHWKEYYKAVQVALLTAKKALQDARIKPDAFGYNMGISFGTTLGAIAEIQKDYCDGGSKGYLHINKNKLIQFSYNTIMDAIAYEFRIKGMRNTLGLACASSSCAIGQAFRTVQNGRLDAVLCGGSDLFSLISHLIMTSMRLISPDKPKPFDKTHNGLILGEGAGFLVLESEESAKRRNANIYCEILGYGETCVAQNLSHSDEEGKGLSLAMRHALKESGCNIQEITYINAHGVGTKSMDEIEVKAIHNVFGDHVKNLRISSIKGAIGHSSGASGALDDIISIMTLLHNKIPPTLNVCSENTISDLNIICDDFESVELNRIMSNSVAIGGINSSIIFGRYTNG